MNLFDLFNTFIHLIVYFNNVVILLIINSVIHLTIYLNILINIINHLTYISTFNNLINILISFTHSLIFSIISLTISLIFIISFAPTLHNLTVYNLMNIRYNQYKLSIQPQPLYFESGCTGSILRLC